MVAAIWTECMVVWGVMWEQTNYYDRDIAR